MDLVIDLSSSTIHITCCIIYHNEKSIYNKRICQHDLVSYLLVNFLANWGFLKKRVKVFTFQRFSNVSCFPRGTYQLKMPPAGEITEPLAFTVSPESNNIVSESCFGCWWTTIIDKTEWKQCVMKQKKNHGAIAEAWLQRDTLDRHET